MIEFISRAHKDPKTGVVKYYAEVAKCTPIDMEGIAELIADGTTLTAVDVKAVARAFEDKISYLLINGHSVRFGDFGSFHLTITSEGKDAAVDVDENSILQLHVNFRKSGKMMKALRKGAPGIHFSKIKNAAEKAFDEEVKAAKELRKQEIREQQRLSMIKENHEIQDEKSSMSDEELTDKPSGI